jgi:hypothetical protein
MISLYKLFNDQLLSISKSLLFKSKIILFNTLKLALFYRKVFLEIMMDLTFSEEGNCRLIKKL